MVGPAVRYEVALDLEADGDQFEVSTPKPATRPSMGCDDEEMSWGFEIPEDELDRVWVIASWVEAKRADLRIAAMARHLSTSETYEWKWAADWRLSGAGHWSKRRSATTPSRAVAGMGPLELGRAPGPRRAPQTRHRHRPGRKTSRSRSRGRLAYRLGAVGVSRYCGEPGGVVPVQPRVRALDGVDDVRHRLALPGQLTHQPARGDHLVGGWKANASLLQCGKELIIDRIGVRRGGHADHTGNADQQQEGSHSFQIVPESR